MRWFWQAFIVPLLGVLRPAVIIEIGAERGLVTEPLLDWADQHGAVVHVIEPMPLFDARSLKSRHPSSFRLHQARSLRVLPQIDAAQLVLVDGDHNYYTVINELRQLERRAAREACLPPLVLLHDVEWPYARRDLYYDPSSIPAQHRHPHARTGMIPGQSDLGTPGLNPDLDNALLEDGPENGVLTAVEDFLRQSPTRWEFSTIPGFHGLGILAPRTLLARRRKLREAIDIPNTAEFLRDHCRAIELERNAATIRCVEASTPAASVSSC